MLYTTILYHFPMAAEYIGSIHRVVLLLSNVGFHMFSLGGPLDLQMVVFDEADLLLDYGSQSSDVQVQPCACGQPQLGVFDVMIWVVVL